MQRAFAFGEIGPTLYGGADSGIYQRALAACRNFIVMRHGGVANRPGTEYVTAVKDSTVKTYLLKFVYNAADTYLIEAGQLYFRFHRLGAPVLVSGVAAWSGATNYVVGDLVVQGGINYYCILGHTNHVPPNATYWYPLSDSILEIPTPYPAADIPLLKYVQSNDIVTLTHPSYAPQELRRTQSRWTLTALSTAPGILAPSGVAAVAGGSGSLTASYIVTAVATDTYEESVGSSASTIASSAVPTATAPTTITWNTVTGAVEYNVYLDKDGNGKYGFIGVASTNSFKDIGFLPDMSVTPPNARTLFNASGDYPGTPAYYQQRLLMAGSTNNPQNVYASRTGFFRNFTISSPIQDDDAVTFGLAGRRINEVRHLIDIGRLIVLTATGEWMVMGDADGVLRPTAINLLQQSYYGSAHILPVVIGSSIIFVQSRGSIIRDFRMEEASTGFIGYEGRDLTLYSPHLFEGVSIDRMDFAQIPHSIVWCVRSDGLLLGLTYIKEQQVWGWHRHETGTSSGTGLNAGATGLSLADASFEDVCVVPETTPPVPGSAIRGKEEDVPYFIIRRTINGTTKRYIERMASRYFFDYRLDAIFSDATLSYNGLNTTATTVTLTTAAGWTPSDLITVTASSGVFSAGDVAKGITVFDSASPPNANRVVVTQYISATVVKGNPIANVQASLQNTPTAVWSRAVSSVSGLDHLEGKAVAVLANGVIVSGKTVSAGAVTALGSLYDVIHVGLPITAEIETLDLDSDQQPVRDKQKLLRAVSLVVQQSRGFLAGPDRNNLIPYQAPLGQTLGTDIFDPTGGLLRTGTIEESLTASWTVAGRIVIRQSDPLPLSVLAIFPNAPVGG